MDIFLNIEVNLGHYVKSKICKGGIPGFAEGATGPSQHERIVRRVADPVVQLRAAEQAAAAEGPDAAEEATAAEEAAAGRALSGLTSLFSIP